MTSVKLDRERGQILVQVALMVVVLFAFVALALDVGNVYAGRRRMQNAADAGALAGAREICFGEHDSLEAAQNRAVEVAEQYAIERNGAHTATVEILDDYTLTVDAGQTLDTFFAGVIGINTAPVRAEAAAVCGGSVSGAMLWPLAFNLGVYTDSIECGQEFMVFASKDQNWKGLDCATEDCGCVQPGSGTTETLDADDDCYELCNCAAIGPHIRPSGLGWLLFPDPEGGLPFPKKECPGGEACGAGRVACWIGHDFPGEIKLPACISGQEGVVADSKIKQAVRDRISETVRIPLWDDETCEDTLGPCPGNKNYHVVRYGCVQVVDYLEPSEHTLSIPKCGNPDETCDSGKNLHIIKVVKLCGECSSLSGASTGVPAQDWESQSVSLIQWPRPPADE